MGRKKCKEQPAKPNQEKLWQKLQERSHKQGKRIDEIITELKKGEILYFKSIADEYDIVGYTVSRRILYSNLLRKLMNSLGKRGYTLDYGGGTGRVSFFLGNRNFRMVCADFSRHMLEICQSRCKNIPNIDLVRCDVEMLPFQPAVFSNVISFGTLHHLPNLKQAFAEMHRVLLPKGVIATHELSMLGNNDVYGKNAKMLHLYCYITRIVIFAFKVFNVLLRRSPRMWHAGKTKTQERPLDPRSISVLLPELGFRIVNLTFTLFSENPLTHLFRSEKLIRVLLWIDKQIYEGKIFSTGSKMIVICQRKRSV